MPTIEHLESRMYLSLALADGMVLCPYIVPGDYTGDHNVDLDDFVHLKNGAAGVDVLKGFVPLKLNWGLATDRPIIADPSVTNPDYVYQSISLPLFLDGTAARDVVQSRVLGDCWLMGTVAAIADAAPEYLTHRIAMLPDGTFLARLTLVSGGDEIIRMSTDLPMLGGYTTYARTNGELWVGLIEKAYAHFRYHADSYESLEGGWPDGAFGALGLNPESEWTWNLDLPTHLTDAMDNGLAVTLVSQTVDVGPIVANHVYAVTDADADGVTLWNPHGWALRQTWEQVAAAFRLETEVTP